MVLYVDAAAPAQIATNPNSAGEIARGVKWDFGKKWISRVCGEKKRDFFQGMVAVGQQNKNRTARGPKYGGQNSSQHGPGVINGGVRFCEC